MQKQYLRHLSRGGVAHGVVPVFRYVRVVDGRAGAAGFDDYDDLAGDGLEGVGQIAERCAYAHHVVVLLAERLARHRHNCPRINHDTAIILLAHHNPPFIFNYF